MKRHLLPIVLGLAAATTLSALGQAAPQVAPVNPPKVGPAPAPPTVAKKFVKLEVTNAAAVPGETRTLEAKMTAISNGAVIAGKKVEFRIESKSGPNASSWPEVQASQGGAIIAGDGTTDATGKVRASFKVPQLPQGSYRLKAIFAGDDETAGANDEGNFGMVKGITKLELSDAQWEGWNAQAKRHGRVNITLRRTSDSAVVGYLTQQGSTFSTVMITTNGDKVGPITLVEGKHQRTLQGEQSAKSWTVKVQYMGDAAYQAAEIQRTYTKP